MSNNQKGENVKNKGERRKLELLQLRGGKRNFTRATEKERMSIGKKEKKSNDRFQY